MKKAVIAGTLAAFLAGCATYQPRPLSPARTADAFEARTLDAVKFKGFVEKNLGRKVATWPPAAWDLDLLTLAAFYYHPDLDLARAKWGVAEAAKITAGERPNPAAGFTPQFNANSLGGISPWILGFNLDIPVETAGKRGYRIAQSERNSEAARLNIASEAWKVRSRLRGRLIELYAAGQRKIILERLDVLYKEILTVQERLLAAGEVTRPDLTQARLALAQNSLLLREADRQAGESLAGVAEAIGLPAAALDRIHLSFPDIDGTPAMPTAQARRQALTRRPDLLAALADYEAAEAALRLEIARQYPDLHLGPGYLWDQGDNKWSLGLSVTLPLFNQNQGPIAQAQARRTEAAARFTSVQAGVIGEIDRALAGYRAALRKRKVADELLATGQTRGRDADDLFRAGEAGRLELLSAGLELEASVQARLEAATGLGQAQGVLEDALHSPLGSAKPIPDIERSPRIEEQDL